MMSNTDRFIAKKWGVMCHLLHSVQNNPDLPSNEGVGQTAWDEFVAQIDVKNMAKELYEMGAGYLLLTIMQGNPYMIAPNATYDKIVGSAPGKYCSTRDLILDLATELKKYDIDLFLYYTGDGPHKDVQTGRAMGFQDRYNEAPVSETFLKNWSSVLKEYAKRYKDVVKGWWIDGCYGYFGYDDEKMRYYYDVLKDVNPDWLVTFNDGYAIEQAWGKEEWAYDPTNDELQKIPVSLRKRFVNEDYLAGEAIDFNVYPESRYVEGAQWHVLSHLGSRDGLWGGWGGIDVRYTKAYLTKYLKAVWEKDGVVTIDMGLKRSGKFYAEQKAFIIDVMNEANK